MLEKLRRKFVIINMALVNTVLIVVLALFCVSAYESQKAETNNALISAAEGRSGMQYSLRPDGGGSFSRTPTFSVIVSPDGTVAAVLKENVIIDDSALITAVNSAYYSDYTVGEIKSLNLRFMKSSSELGLKISFADTSAEGARLRSALTNSLLIGGAALVAFFLISLWLSKLAIDPVKFSWEQQRRFIADASHELKTPLTVMLANVDILLAHKDESINDQIKWVENTKTEVTDMKRLVDDLLYLAKYDDSRKTLPERQMTDISDTVTSCILPFEAVSFENGVTIDSQIQEGLTANTNAATVKQIVSVLVDNACKYSDKGKAVRIILSRIGNDIILTVNNKGEVISEKDLFRIFDRFYRCDESREKERGGFGLGLSIAKSGADMIGAKLSATSDEANGTTFMLKLPAAN